ncbi:hypothetical protein D3C80_1259370 [compost metagenome]
MHASAVGGAQDDRFIFVDTAGAHTDTASSAHRGAKEKRLRCGLHRLQGNLQVIRRWIADGGKLIDIERHAREGFRASGLGLCDVDLKQAGNDHADRIGQLVAVQPGEQARRVVVVGVHGKDPARMR